MLHKTAEIYTSSVSGFSISNFSYATLSKKFLHFWGVRKSELAWQLYIAENYSNRIRGVKVSFPCTWHCTVYKIEEENKALEDKYLCVWKAKPLVLSKAAHLLYNSRHNILLAENFQNKKVTGHDRKKSNYRGEANQTLVVSGGGGGALLDPSRHVLGCPIRPGLEHTPETWTRGVPDPDEGYPRNGLKVSPLWTDKKH